MDVKKIAKKGFNRKIILVAITIITLVSSLGGAFLFLKKETPPEEWDESLYSKPEDYVIKETDEGKIVENEKAGLSFKVPEGWRIEKPEQGTYVAMYSPDAEGTTVSPEGIKSGCEIIVQVMYIKTNIEAVEQSLRELHQNEAFAKDEYEIIEVDGHKALENRVEIPPLNLYGASIHIPMGDLLKGKLHFLRIGSGLGDMEKCIEELEGFLGTVSIN